MVDIETYDTTVTSAVREICIAAFDFTNFKIISLIDLYPETAQQYIDGRTKSESTLNFWKRNVSADLYIYRKMTEEKMSAKSAATKVLDFINKLNKNYDLCFISRGATTFDFPILNNFVKMYTDTPLPFEYYKIYDLRSFTNILKCIVPNFTIKTLSLGDHTAIVDVKKQILSLERFSDIIDKEHLNNYE